MQAAHYRAVAAVEGDLMAILMVNSVQSCAWHPEKHRCFSVKLPIGNEMALCAVKYRAGARCEIYCINEKRKSRIAKTLNQSQRRDPSTLLGMTKKWST